MAKRQLEDLFKRTVETADRLAQEEETLNPAEVAARLRQSGIDPDALKQRLFEATRNLANRERAAGRPATLALKQALEKLAPDTEMPANPNEARAKMGRWFDRFAAPFAIPAQLEVLRANRKRGELSTADEVELDQLEEMLKEDVRKEHEGKS